ncbi:hypothetical protein [Brevundimonas lutea]|uniref:hypothetical protein n=1 Tax=Brevundimonas lutea TaxID=2293980 RepID=UPI000F017449|nr:hypothetical protein [Brevundimonas lutea]
MRRRDVLATSLILAGTAGTAAAAPSSEPAAPPSTNMLGVGLPVIAGGRVRNYIFVTLRLVLAPGADMAAVRAKEPFLRDGLVRAAHRTPLPTAADGLSFDPARLTGVVTRMAPTVVGRGLIARVEVASQAPRRRTGIRGG